MFQPLSAKHMAWYSLGVCHSLSLKEHFGSPALTESSEWVTVASWLWVGSREICYKRFGVPGKNCVALSISQKVGHYWWVLKVRASWSVFDFPSKSAFVCWVASFQSPLLIFVVFSSKQTQFYITWIVFSSPPTCMVSIIDVLELLSLSSVFCHYAPKTCFLDFTSGELE